MSVSRCVITKNKDGSRLGLCRASFDHCDIEHNSGKGLNFCHSMGDVTFCDITDNLDGIFLNEKDSACDIEHNNIHDNRGMNVRLGDFHKDDVKFAEDWWGSADLSEIKKKIYDRASDPAIGKASIILPLSRKVLGAGPDGPGIKIKWKFKTGAYVDGGAVEDNGAVYFGSWDKNFYAVRADNGKLIWKFNAGDCVDSTPAISGGKIYFGSWNRYVYCLNAKDGKLTWKFRMPRSNFDDHRQSSPVVYNKVVYMGGFNGIVYALNAETGKEIWKFNTKGPIRSKLLLSSWAAAGLAPPSKLPCIYAGSGDKTLYSLSLVNGHVYRKVQTGGAVYSSPASDNIGTITSCIYFGSADGRLYCLNELNGQIRWKYSTGSIIVYSSPLIFNNLVYIGDCSGTLHAVNKDTGKGVWKFTGGGVIYSSPVLARVAQAASDRVGGAGFEAKILYGDNSGGVYCLNPNTGGLLAFFKAGNAVQGLTSGVGGATAYASSRDGFLYALTISE